MKIILDDPLFIIEKGKVFVDVSEFFETKESAPKEQQKIFDDTVAEKKPVVKKPIVKKPEAKKSTTKKSKGSTSVTDFASLTIGGKVTVKIIDKTVMGISEDIDEFPASIKALTGNILTLIAEVPLDGDKDTVWDVEPTDLGTVVEIIKR